MRVREKYLPTGSRKKLSLADYIKQRRETGICETCNQEMKTHDRCEACGILCGPWHDCQLAPIWGMIFAFYAIWSGIKKNKDRGNSSALRTLRELMS